MAGRVLLTYPTDVMAERAPDHAKQLRAGVRKPVTKLPFSRSKSQPRAIAGSSPALYSAGVAFRSNGIGAMSISMKMRPVAISSFFGSARCTRAGGPCCVRKLLASCRFCALLVTKRPDSSRVIVTHTREVSASKDASVMNSGIN
jgi:hypothetical protein